MMREYAWTILVVAGVFETGFSIGLKYSEGFTRLWPSVATAIMIVLSLGLVGVATRSLPLGTAYAVWTGIGAVGTVGLGIVLFGESAAFSRLAWADRYGNSRIESDWRITQHSAAENLRTTYHIMKQALFIVDVQPSFPISMEIL